MSIHQINELQEDTQMAVHTPDLELAETDYLAESDLPEERELEEEAEPSSGQKERIDQGYNVLASYFKAVGRYTLLTREDEVRLAKIIDEGKKTRWRILAGLPPVVERIATMYAEVVADPNYYKAILDPSAYRTRAMAKIAHRRLLKYLGQIKQLHNRTRYARNAKSQKRLAELRTQIGTLLYRIPWSDTQIKDFVKGLESLNNQSQSLGGAARPGSSATAESIRAFSSTVGCRPEEVAEVYRRFQTNEEAIAQAKEAFVVSNLKLVLSIAHRYHAHGLQLIDLIQEGNLGLMRAVDKFDYRKGYKFSTYASWWIRQAVSRSIADKDRLIRLPVHIQEITMRLAAVITKFTKTHARRPTIAELASIMKIPARRLEKLMQETADVVSLETPVMHNEESSFMDFVADSYTSDPATVVENRLMRERVSSALKYLNPREETIIRMRFGLTEDHKEHTLDDVGRTLGLTRERIRQIEQKALQKLRSPESEVGLKNFTNAVDEMNVEQRRG